MREVEAVAFSVDIFVVSSVNGEGLEALQTCAVVGAVDEARLTSYFKLQRELAYMEQKTDTAAKLAEKRKWKQISKSIKKNNFRRVKS